MLIYHYSQILLVAIPVFLVPYPVCVSRHLELSLGIHWKWIRKNYYSETIDVLIARATPLVIHILAYTQKNARSERAFRRKAQGCVLFLKDDT